MAHPMRGGQISTVLAVCASVLCLSSDQSGATPSPAPTVLHFVSWKPDHPQVWDDAIRAFTDTHPHITIVREIAPHSSTAYHDLLTQKLKNRDTSVDVFMMDVIWVPEFAAAGWARPLDDVFPPPARVDFLPATIEVGLYQTAIFGVPSRIDAGMLYYRADLLQHYGFTPPHTWDELIRQATTIVAGERAHQPTLQGYSAQFKQYEGLVCNLLEFIGGFGGRLLQPDERTSALSSTEALAAVRFVRERVIGTVAPRATLTYQEPESLAAFLQGQAVFHRNWPYAWELANDPAHSRVAGKIGRTALPGDGRHPGLATLGGWLYGISALSTHPREAWDFIAFLTSAERQRVFALKAGIAPSRRTVYADPALRESSSDWSQHLVVLESATARPRSPLYPSISHVLQRYFSRALAFPDSDLTHDAAIADHQINQFLALSRRGM